MSKIAFFLSGSRAGGGFSHLTSFVENICKLFKNKKNIYFISTNKQLYLDLLKKKLNVHLYKVSLLERILSKLNKILNLYKFSFNYNFFEKFIKKKKITKLIFNEPSLYINFCKNLNFSSYIFNTEIDDVKKFKEFQNGVYENQRNIITNIVNYANKILVFTEQNKIDLIERFNCNSNKILIQNLIPHLPKLKLKIKKNKNFQSQNKKKKIINFFYPSQFFEHKNHILIIKIGKILKKRKIKNINFIFSGNDRGNLKTIQNQIEKYKLDNIIKIVGELSEQSMILMYKFCDYVINPTFLGRSSMPLLESFYFKKIIFYNKNILDKKLLDYVVSIDPYNANNSLNIILRFISNKKKINILQKKINNLYKKICSKEKFNKTISKIILD